jgi:hypothetical protein
MISDYAEAIIMDGICRATSNTWPAALYLALFTTPIRKQDDIGTPTEVSGGAYARQAVTFAAWTKNASKNSAAVTFPAPTADWGTVVAIALTDASSSGHIWSSTPVCPIVLKNGDGAFSLAVGSIKAALSTLQSGC